MNIEASEVRTQFASSVKRWRRQRGFSQEELAERADLHRTYISDVERGARNLSLESIDKLARALEVSVPILFYNHPPEEPEGATSTPFPPVSEFVDILLVEDNPDDVELTLQAFQQARFVNSVRVVRDGAEALDLFFGKGAFADHIRDARRQIVLLDLNLPKVNGIEVLRRLKADKRTAQIPVVVLTISEKDRDIAECQHLGAAAFITKPVSFQGLSKVTPGLCLVWALIKPPTPNENPRLDN